MDDGSTAAENDAAVTEALLASVGGRVRRIRGERHMTIRELAERAKLSVRFVAQLEAGEANIAVGRLAALARALDARLSDLVGDEAEPSGPRAAIERLLGDLGDEELERCLRAIELVLGEERRSAVALLGLRGAGKSTVGPRLARALDVGFVELDERIEEEAGLKLAEIFALHGEAYYRRLEGRCLADLLADGRPRVVALPGGIVNSEDAFAFALRHCTTVWLKAKPEDHMRRVLRQGDERPVANRPNAMAELEAILAAREPLYAQADVTVDTSRRDAAGAVKAILAALPRAGWSVRA